MKNLLCTASALSVCFASLLVLAASDDDLYENPPEHPIPIEADELFQAYKTNPDFSDKIYKGRLIDIYGVAEKPYGPVGDNFLISFRVNEQPNPRGVLGVQASISKKHSEFIRKINAGDQVTMICTGGGRDKNGMPWLLNCHP